MSVRVTEVIYGSDAAGKLQGYHRVVHENSVKSTLIIIKIPIATSEGALPSYFRGVREVCVADVSDAFERGEIVKTTLNFDPAMAAVDKEIDDWIEDGYGNIVDADVLRLSTAAQIGWKRWVSIRPVYEWLLDNPIEGFEGSGLANMVKSRSFELKCNARDLRNLVNRLLAFGMGRSSLMPLTYKCGAPGREREPRNCTRLGRKPTAYNEGKLPSPGIHPSQSDKNNLRIGFQEFVKKHGSVEVAYDLMLNKFYSTGYQVAGEEIKPILLPESQRPSFAQFLYWGPKGDDAKTAARLMMSKDDFNQRFRGMLGSASNGIKTVGQVGVMDATGIHVTFVSQGSFLKALGQGHRIVVHDALSEVVTGFYVGLKPPSAHTANLAIYSSAADKVDYFSRFGVEITADECPAAFYRRYRADNGELRNQSSMQLLGAMSSAIEYVERRRPELKQQVEGGHRVVHAHLDNKLSGSTRGMSRKRGEEHSAIAACWKWYDYMVEFLKAVKWFNCVDDATSLINRHPYRLQMLQDGVKPNRAAIYKWCKDNGYIGSPAYDIEIIKAKLLPKYNATVKQNGVFLQRPDKGVKSEFVRGIRYVGQRGVELKWFEGPRKTMNITLHVDPESPSTAWFFDACGAHRFENVNPDLASHKLCTLADLIDLQDAQLSQRNIDEEDSRNASVQNTVTRVAKNRRRQVDKKAEIKAVGKPVSKEMLKANIKENRIVEEAVLAEVGYDTHEPKVGSHAVKNESSTKSPNVKLRSMNGNSYFSDLDKLFD